LAAAAPMAADQVPMLLAVDEEEFYVLPPERRSTLQGWRVRAGAACLAVGVVAFATQSVGREAQRFQSNSEFESKFSEKTATTAKRKCRWIPGVQLAEPDDKTSLWKSCSDKWSEDCSDTGCCNDVGMKCYNKKEGWAACKADCQKKDEKNESWTCDVVGLPAPHTPEECFVQCEMDTTCKQAVFSKDGGGSCRFSTQHLTTIAWASDDVNSTICGEVEEEDELKEAMQKVYKQLPFQMEWPIVDCSWGGEDCSKTLCCNDYLCDKNYQNCAGFSCFKKTEYFSGCAAEAPEGWDGEWQGGAREHRIVPPASSQVAVQGTSLYCITVVTWDAPPPKPFWNSERELADNWKSKGIHVMQCDGHEIIDGVMTPKAEWGSFSNIDMFMGIWKKVKDLGNWQNHDWTVKVDSDAVFFPHRLKDHLLKLRTPRGSRVYLENINFKFKFMGAIEIMTKEALGRFLELGHECIRGEHAGGEDSFLKGCLEGLGIDHQVDHEILRDKYAGLDPPCTDGWAVAYHYLKKTHDWSRCYNEALCGSPDEGSCEGAIAVPFEPGDSRVA